MLLKWTYNCGALLYKTQQLVHEKVNESEFFIRMQSIMRHRISTVTRFVLYHLTDTLRCIRKYHIALKTAEKAQWKKH